MDTGTLMLQALELTVVGTAMVFVVLAVFYGLIKLLMWVFPGSK